MLRAQLPSVEGDRQRYHFQLDFRKAYLSGVLSMLMEDGVIRCAVVNEFGVSTIEFIYSPAKDKVKIIYLVSRLNRWYIKKVIRRDLKAVMHCLERGEMGYENKRYQTIFVLSPYESQ